MCEKEFTDDPCADTITRGYSKVSGLGGSEES